MKREYDFKGALRHFRAIVKADAEEFVNADITAYRRAAIKALSSMPEYEQLKRRNTPMEVIVIDGMELEETRCGNCNNILSQFDNYCSECGQAIKHKE